MKSIWINELAAPSLNRERGREAFEKLRSFAENSQSWVLLDNSRTLSTSFLDELLLRLSSSGILNSVCFVTNSPRTRRKLSNIAAIRDLRVFCSASSGGVPEALPLPC